MLLIDIDLRAFLILSSRNEPRLTEMRRNDAEERWLPERVQIEDEEQISCGGYTLSSIAAVVVAGHSLYGGSGGAIGTIFGASSPAPSRSALRLRSGPALATTLPRIVLLISVSLGSFGCSGSRSA